MSQARVQRRLAAILFADVVGYSRLTGQDEVGTWQRLHTIIRDEVRPHIQGHDGRIIRAALDDAWRLVLNDPDYMNRRRCEERKRDQALALRASGARG